jgi:hypothetical protein
MSRHSLHNSVLLQPVLGFVILCALIGVFGLAGAAHLIDPDTKQRAYGQVVSLMLLVMGNFLPKLRPLQASRIDRGTGAGAERFAGRTLLLAGLVSFTVFIGMPLREAELAAAWLGVGTLTMIVSHWSWLAYSARLGEPAAARSAPVERPAEATSSREWRTSIWLLIGYTYICTSAWALDLLRESAVRDEARTWLVTVFSMLISVVFPVMEGYPRARCRSGLGVE